jgi:asparagine synthase (glutamine-hydrolysing)
LTNNDLYEHLFDILDYIDEPFADSSAIAVNILSRHTRSKVTVALSGDGADELFAGYNKHYAEYNARKGSLTNLLLKAGGPVLKTLPQSRNSKTGNLFRQLDRYAQGLNMNEKERYWRWCSFTTEQDAWKALAHLTSSKIDKAAYGQRKKEILQYINKGGSFNDVLYSDMHLVLQNDMLTKVDLMSMAHGLEVRVPFLAHNFVNFIFSLPSEYKIHNGERKRILKDAFRDMLPAELFSRPKHGFEVPLLKWFQGELRSLITDDLLSDSFIRAQGIFDPGAINQLKKQLFSSSPGEVQARIWGLIVFQYWCKKYLAH